MSRSVKLGFVGVVEMKWTPERCLLCVKGGGPRKRWRDCNKLPQLQYLCLIESLSFNNPSVTSWQLPLHKGAFRTCVKQLDKFQFIINYIHIIKTMTTKNPMIIYWYFQNPIIYRHLRLGAISQPFSVFWYVGILLKI